MADGEFNIMDAVEAALNSAKKLRGHVNVLIVGKTGTGKSTLINAVFSGRLAETGQGKPVTQHIKKYTRDGLPVSIYDSRGLELGNYKEIVTELQSKIRELNRHENPEEHIHVAWLCIAEGSRRIEDAEIELAKALDDAGVPVIAVITTAVSDQGFKSALEKELHMASNVVRVNSVPLELDEGVTAPIRGIDILVDQTMEVVPKGQKNAFAAAQKVKVDIKVERSRLAVKGFAVTAAGIGATPIPFSDAVGIIPVQISMLASISALFGIDVTTGFLTTLAGSTFTSIAGTMSGRAIVGGLLKLVPGAGSVVGGTISAATAGALTVAFGEAYIAVLRKLMVENPESTPSASDIADAFKRQLGK